LKKPTVYQIKRWEGKGKLSIVAAGTNIKEQMQK
jgi:hypothetical protein